MKSIATAGVLALLAILPAAGQDEYPFIMEGLPHHLESRVAAQDGSLQLGLISMPDDSFISPVKVWPTDAPIRVCFFDGPQQVRARIARAAMKWTGQGALIPLDFGDPGNPRLCSTAVRSQIRIGFSYPGYWSLVGTDSITLANQGEQSMNFHLFDINPPPDPEFTRLVLHEFGHALGFRHEHQSPAAACAAEFDWDAIYARLAQSPNFWSKERVDRNMRPISTTQGVGTFDRSSIMLYTFPRAFYRVNDPTCYASGNNSLSNGDIAAARRYYPATQNEVAAIRAETLAAYQAQIDALPINALQRNIAKVQATTLLQPEDLKALSPADLQSLINPGRNWLGPVAPAELFQPQ